MYTESQIVAAVERGLVDFSGFIAQLKASTNDQKFLLHVDRLLMNIYVAHKSNRYISKMQACRMIPAEHVDTCKKYVEEAERLNFIRFERDPKDGRRTNVVPTREFLDYVGDAARRRLDEVKDIISASH